MATENKRCHGRGITFLWQCDAIPRDNSYTIARRTIPAGQSLSIAYTRLRAIKPLSCEDTLRSHLS
jgi:hypothetical protein